MAENEIPQNPTTEAERIAALAAYKPEDHLTEWEKGGQIIMYYPAAWRLYELGLKFPKARFEETQIVEMDKEQNYVLLRSKVFIGESWEKATRRGSGLKQCSLTNIDKAETAAMARAARNFGVSPTLGLDMDDESIGQVVKKTEAEKQSKNAAGRKRSQDNQNARPTQAASQSQQATRPAEKEGLQAQKQLAQKMAERLGIKVPPLDRMDAQKIREFIQDCKRENEQRQQTAKAEAAARAEMTAKK